jgi:hypothetical protein
MFLHGTVNLLGLFWRFVPVGLDLFSGRARWAGRARFFFSRSRSLGAQCTRSGAFDGRARADARVDRQRNIREHACARAISSKTTGGASIEARVSVFSETEVPRRTSVFRERREYEA